MTNETQMIDLSEVDSISLIEELDSRGELPSINDFDSNSLREELESRGDMPIIDEFDDDEISDEFYARGLEKSISDFDDSDIELEYKERNPSTAKVIEIAEYINHRIGLGLDYQDDINDLLELVKSL
jgi:hypothetical protein